MRTSEKKWMNLMKKLSLNLFNFAIIILFTFSFAYSSEISIAKGKARIIDGDTIEISDEKIRFGGIDTPEKKDICYLNEKKVFCGKLSTEKLREKIGNSTVACVREKNKDRYGRTVAECFVNEESLSSFMVKIGYACDYVRYSKGKYAKEQEYAKANKLGVWKMKYKLSWENKCKKK